MKTGVRTSLPQVRNNYVMNNPPSLTKIGEEKERGPQAKKKKKKRESQQHEPKGTFLSGRQIIGFPPWQIKQNTHNGRQEYGSGSLFLP